MWVHCVVVRPSAAPAAKLFLHVYMSEWYNGKSVLVSTERLMVRFPNCETNNSFVDLLRDQYPHVYGDHAKFILQVGTYRETRQGSPSQEPPFNGISKCVKGVTRVTQKLHK